MGAPWVHKVCSNKVIPVSDIKTQRTNIRGVPQKKCFFCSLRKVGRLRPNFFVRQTKVRIVILVGDTFLRRDEILVLNSIVFFSAFTSRTKVSPGPYPPKMIVLLKWIWTNQYFVNALWFYHERGRMLSFFTRYDTGTYGIIPYRTRTFRIDQFSQRAQLLIGSARLTNSPHAYRYKPLAWRTDRPIPTNIHAMPAWGQWMMRIRSKIKKRENELSSFLLLVTIKLTKESNALDQLFEYSHKDLLNR